MWNRVRPHGASDSYVACAMAKLTDFGCQWRRKKVGSAAILGARSVAFATQLSALRSTPPPRPRPLPLPLPRRRPGILPSVSDHDSAIVCPTS